MINKEYREVQLSSSQVVIIFLGILILGVVIFLLGVSVGKKQAQIVKASETTPPAAAGQAEDKVSLPSSEPKDSISKELASYQKIKEETQKKAPETAKANLYYIQVGAFNNKEAALVFAEEFKKKGYKSLVLDPYPSDKKPLFRVRIGGFETLEEAEKAKAGLLSETKKKADYFITKG